MNRWTRSGEYHWCGLSPSVRPRNSPTTRTLRPEVGFASSVFCAHGSYPSPLTTTYFAPAMARLSLGFASYECGSVAGLVMMLVTATWEPPSWRTMLPQKFSAATTVIEADDVDRIEDGATDRVAADAIARGASTTPATATRNAAVRRHPRGERAAPRFLARAGIAVLSAPIEPN